MKILAPGTSNPNQLRESLVYTPTFSPFGMPLIFVAESLEDAEALLGAKVCLEKVLGKEIQFDDLRTNPQVGTRFMRFGSLHLILTPEA